MNYTWKWNRALNHESIKTHWIMSLRPSRTLFPFGIKIKVSTEVDLLHQLSPRQPRQWLPGPEQKTSKRELNLGWVQPLICGDLLVCYPFYPDWYKYRWENGWKQCSLSSCSKICRSFSMFPNDLCHLFHWKTIQSTLQIKRGITARQYYQFVFS